MQRLDSPPGSVASMDESVASASESSYSRDSDHERGDEDDDDGAALDPALLQSPRTSLAAAMDSSQQDDDDSGTDGDTNQTGGTPTALRTDLGAIENWAVQRRTSLGVGHLTSHMQMLRMRRATVHADNAGRPPALPEADTPTSSVPDDSQTPRGAVEPDRRRPPRQGAAVTRRPWAIDEGPGAQSSDSFEDTYEDSMESDESAAARAFAPQVRFAALPFQTCSKAGTLHARQCEQRIAEGGICDGWRRLLRLLHADKVREKSTYDAYSGHRVTSDRPPPPPRRRAKEPPPPRKGAAAARPRTAPSRALAPEPTRPAFPGERTERSVRDWLKRHRGSSASQDAAAPVRARRRASAVPYKAHRFEAGLAPGDVLVTVEHCHSCSLHAASLRHDESRYTGMCLAIEAAVAARLTHSKQLRLLVLRVPCDLSKERIGAMEVQACVSGLSGTFQRHIHSKLASGRWPCPKAIAKAAADLVREAAEADLRMLRSALDDAGAAAKKAESRERAIHSAIGVSGMSSGRGDGWRRGRLCWEHMASKEDAVKLAERDRVLASHAASLPDCEVAWERGRRLALAAAADEDDGAGGGEGEAASTASTGGKGGTRGKGGKGGTGERVGRRAKGAASARSLFDARREPGEAELVARIRQRIGARGLEKLRRRLLAAARRGEVATQEAAFGRWKGLLRHAELEAMYAEADAEFLALDAASTPRTARLRLSKEEVHLLREKVEEQAERIVAARGHPRRPCEELSLVLRCLIEQIGEQRFLEPFERKDGKALPAEDVRAMLLECGYEYDGETFDAAFAGADLNSDRRATFDDLHDLAFAGSRCRCLLAGLRARVRREGLHTVGTAELAAKILKGGGGFTMVSRTALLQGLHQLLPVSEAEATAIDDGFGVSDQSGSPTGVLRFDEFMLWLLPPPVQAVLRRVAATLVEAGTTSEAALRELLQAFTSADGRTFTIRDFLTAVEMEALDVDWWEARAIANELNAGSSEKSIDMDVLIARIGPLLALPQV